MSQSNDSGLNLGHLEAPVIATWQERMQSTKLTWKAAEGKSAAEFQLMSDEIADLRAALANQPAPTVPAGNAREAFEAWHRSKFATKHLTGQPTRDIRNGIYAENYGPENQQQMWEAWQAALAHQPAQEQAEPPRTAEEMVAFIGNHYSHMQCAFSDPMDIVYNLTVHDLLSAMSDWFEDEDSSN